MNLRQRQKFYQTREWRAMSRFIRQRDKWLCADCRPRTVGATLVHHIVPLSAGGPPLEESNLISLCSAHHRDRHGQVVDEGKREWAIYIKDLMEKF